MSERADNQNGVVPLRKLSDAIREVKNAAADREDVVVELREATRMRLQLLAAELAPVFAEIPADVDNFDFVLSSGMQPRLWVDSVSHVSMGRDRRTYRFLKDTRIGRVVLGESVRMEAIADAVTRYVAERIVERERLLEGSVAPAVEGALAQHVREAEPPLRGGRSQIMSRLAAGFWILLAGGIFGLAAATVMLWTKLTAIN